MTLNSPVTINCDTKLMNLSIINKSTTNSPLIVPMSNNAVNPRSQTYHMGMVYTSICADFWMVYDIGFTTLMSPFLATSRNSSIQYVLLCIGINLPNWIQLYYIIGDGCCSNDASNWQVEWPGPSCWCVHHRMSGHDQQFHWRRTPLDGCVPLHIDLLPSLSGDWHGLNGEAEPQDEEAPSEEAAPLSCRAVISFINGWTNTSY